MRIVPQWVCFQSERLTGFDILSNFGLLNRSDTSVECFEAELDATKNNGESDYERFH